MSDGAQTMELMHGDAVAAVVLYAAPRAAIIDVREVMDVSHLPLCAVRLDGSVDVGTLQWWWSSRLAPLARMPRSLATRQAMERLLRESRYASLSDSYWLRAPGDNNQWADVSFYHNSFDAETGRLLLGTMSLSSLAGYSLSNPSSQTNGGLRKYWRIAPDGSRELVKASGLRGREAANEYAVSCIAHAILPKGSFVPYRLEKDMDGHLWSVCTCFCSDSIEYVPFSVLLADDDPDWGCDLWGRVLDIGKSMEVDLHRPLSMMVVLDAIAGNEDRHLGNFGLLRDPTTLKVLGAAPIFDNGTSLFTSQEEHPVYAPFAESPLQQLDLELDLSWLDVAALDGVPGIVCRALKSAGVDEAIVQDVVDGVSWRCEVVTAH